MKKINFNNNMGFALVETLIVTAFVSILFSLIYLNFYPLIGEYEKRENYDDVNSKYGVYWIKKILQDDSSNTCFNDLSSGNSIVKQDCSCLSDEYRDLCSSMSLKLGIKNNTFYITYYRLKDDDNNIDVKTEVKTSNDFSEKFRDYIDHLPNYSAFTSSNGADYRVIVEFERKAKDGVSKEYTYNTYSNMEVKR